MNWKNRWLLNGAQKVRTVCTMPEPKNTENVRSVLKTFLNNLPKMPFNYCRKDKKPILGREHKNITAKQIMNNLWVFLYLTKFSKKWIWNCLFRRQIKLIQVLHTYKKVDKTKVKTGEPHTFVMDCISCMAVEQFNKFHCKTTLTIHNFTFYNLTKNQCTNYWWNESEADWVASVFPSIIIHRLEKHFKENSHSVMELWLSLPK